MLRDKGGGEGAAGEEVAKGTGISGWIESEVMIGKDTTGDEGADKLGELIKAGVEEGRCGEGEDGGDEVIRP